MLVHVHPVTAKIKFLQQQLYTPCAILGLVLIAIMDLNVSNRPIETSSFSKHPISVYLAHRASIQTQHRCSALSATNIQPRPARAVGGNRVRFSSRSQTPNSTQKFEPKSCFSHQQKPIHKLSQFASSSVQKRQGLFNFLGGLIVFFKPVLSFREPLFAGSY